jgi:hypothetical protein
VVEKSGAMSLLNLCPMAHLKRMWVEPAMEICDFSMYRQCKGQHVRVWGRESGVESRGFHVCRGVGRIGGEEDYAKISNSFTSKDSMQCTYSLASVALHIGRTAQASALRDSWLARPHAL